MRSQKLGEPKPGIGRIALESGVPIVPVAIKGSERARQWTRLRFPKVTVEFAHPVSFQLEESPSRERQMEIAGEIFRRVRKMHQD